MSGVPPYHNHTNARDGKFRRQAQDLSLKIRAVSSRPLLSFEEGIQRALSIAFKIERDECKAQILQPRRNLLR